MRAIALFVVILVALAGCGKSPRAAESEVVLTEHQRDSVIARSSLPGGQVVGRAMSQSDRVTRRAAAMDSLAR